jgi:hypothetical protein
MDDNGGSGAINPTSVAVAGPITATGAIQTTSTATDSLKTAGDVQMATGKSVRLNAAGTTNVMDNAGQLVLTGADGSARAAGAFAVGGVATLGNGSANYFTATPAASSSHPALAAAGSDTNIHVDVTPKGNGALRVNGLKVPVLHGAATVAMAIESGNTTIGGGGSVAVTFGTEFAAAPMFVATSAAATGNAVGHDGASTTGATIRGAAGEPVDWIAIGRL